jgi:hypothetical protein
MVRVLPSSWRSARPSSARRSASSGEPWPRSPGPRAAPPPGWAPARAAPADRSSSAGRWCRASPGWHRPRGVRRSASPAGRSPGARPRRPRGGAATAGSGGARGSRIARRAARARRHPCRGPPHARRWGCVGLRVRSSGKETGQGTENGNRKMLPCSQRAPGRGGALYPLPWADTGRSLATLAGLPGGLGWRVGGGARLHHGLAALGGGRGVA